MKRALFAIGSVTIAATAVWVEAANAQYAPAPPAYTPPPAYGPSPTYTPSPHYTRGGPGYAYGYGPSACGDEPARHGNRRHAVLQRQLGGALGRQAGLNDDGVGPVSLHRDESTL